MANNLKNKRQLSDRELKWVKTQQRFLSGKFEDVKAYLRDNSAIRHIEDEHQDVTNERMLNNVIVGNKHGDSRFTNEEIMYDTMSWALDDNMEAIAQFLFDPKKTQDKLLIEQQYDDMDDPIGTGFAAESSVKKYNVQFNQKINPVKTTGICMVIIRDPRSEQGFQIQTACPAVYPDLLNPEDILEVDKDKDVIPILENTLTYKAEHTSKIRKLGLRAACGDPKLACAYIDYQEPWKDHPEQLFIMDKNTLEKSKSPAVVIKQARNGNLTMQCTEASFESADRYSPIIKAVYGKTSDQRAFAKQNPHLVIAAETFFDQSFEQQPTRKGPAKPKGSPRGLNQVDSPVADLESPDYS